MSGEVKPRVRAPAAAKKGELVEIKTLITHPMESGQRKDQAGQTVPRKILARFACTYNGRPVFAATFEPAVSANPYLSFFVRASESGTLRLTWTDDDGTAYSLDHAIAVA